jgi:hypothetical protein
MTFDLNLIKPSYNVNMADMVIGSQVSSGNGLELEFLGTSSAQATETRNVACIAFKFRIFLLNLPHTNW